MKESGGAKFAAGAGALLGFISTGCANCGFSLFSVFYMTRKLNKSRFCETK